MKRSCSDCRFNKLDITDFPCDICGPNFEEWKPIIGPIKTKLMNTTDHQFLPSRKYQGDGGADLRARLDKPVRLYPHEIYKVPTGIAVEVPPGHVGLIQPRSGASSEGKLVITGTVDSNYRGEMLMTVININDEGYFVIQPGERLAQLVIVPVYIAEFELVEELSETDRGANGFGSTGRD